MPRVSVATVLLISRTILQLFNLTSCDEQVLHSNISTDDIKNQNLQDQTKSYKEGETAILECSLEGQRGQLTPDGASWFNPNKEIIAETNDSFRIYARRHPLDATEIANNTYQLTLIIKRMSSEDGGQYVCATNQSSDGTWQTIKSVAINITPSASPPGGEVNIPSPPPDFNIPSSPSATTSVKQSSTLSNGVEPQISLEQKVAQEKMDKFATEGKITIPPAPEVQLSEVTDSKLFQNVLKTDAPPTVSRERVRGNLRGGRQPVNPQRKEISLSVTPLYSSPPTVKDATTLSGQASPAVSSSIPVILTESGKTSDATIIAGKIDVMRSEDIFTNVEAASNGIVQSDDSFTAIPPSKSESSFTTHTVKTIDVSTEATTTSNETAAAVKSITSTTTEASKPDVISVFETTSSVESKTTTSFPPSITHASAKIDDPKNNNNVANVTTKSPNPSVAAELYNVPDSLPDDEDDVLGGDSTGLLIGVVLAALVTGICATIVLCRLRSRRRKSKYIAFGNPSYSREHLPANDLRMDHPLTLSSNGYTVLA